MEAGIASTLLFVYPILVALIMAFVFKEKLTLQTIFCILLALGGIGLLYKSGDGTTLSLTGVLLVMASALSYAIYIVGANRPLLKNIATLKLTFYVLLFGMTLFLVRIDFGRSLPNRYLFPLHDTGGPIYRLHPDGYPRSFGTVDRRILRSDCLR